MKRELLKTFKGNREGFNEFKFEFFPLLTGIKFVYINTLQCNLIL